MVRRQKTVTYDSLQVTLLPEHIDNYTFICSNDRGCFVIDPYSADSTLEFIKKQNLTLTHILLTHHHPDHTGGVLKLKSETQAIVVGSRLEPERLPPLDLKVQNLDVITLLNQKIQVFHTPGHTRDHIVYFVKNLNILFCGDVVFGLGCGRLFEGTPNDLFGSLNLIRNLPDTTDIYCTHEYTLRNAPFARKILPDNKTLTSRIEDINACPEPRCTLPLRLSEEIATNPFLRWDDPHVATELNLTGAQPKEILGALRKRRDLS